MSNFKKLIVIIVGFSIGMLMAHMASAYTSDRTSDYCKKTERYVTTDSPQAGYCCHMRSTMNILEKTNNCLSHVKSIKTDDAMDIYELCLHNTYALYCNRMY